MDQFRTVGVDHFQSVGSSAGFIVSAWEDRRRDGTARRILATGRLEDGRSVALVLPAPPPALYVAARDGARAAAALARSHRAVLEAASWSDLSGVELCRLTLADAGAIEEAERRLLREGIAVQHTERPRASDVFLGLGITGPVVIQGAPTPGRRVDVVFANAALSPATTCLPSRGAPSTSKPTAVVP